MSAISAVTSEGGFVVVEIVNGVKHHLHRALLAQHSEYFKKALDGPWMEAEKGVVRLEDVESGPFNIFVDWLYTKNVSVKARSGGVDDDIYDIAELNAIVLGDRLLAPTFTKAIQNPFIDAYASMNKVPPFTVIICAYSKLSGDNPILEMLADLHVTFHVEKAPSKTAKNCRIEDKLPRKFLLRIMHKYAQKKTVCKRDRVWANDYKDGPTNAAHDSLARDNQRCSIRTGTLLWDEYEYELSP